MPKQKSPEAIHSMPTATPPLACSPGGEEVPQQDKGGGEDGRAGDGEQQG